MAEWVDWPEKRKTNMVGVVTYDLEPPTATRHFLLIGSGKRQQVTNMAGVVTYDTALTR